MVEMIASGSIKVHGDSAHVRGSSTPVEQRFVQMGVMPDAASVRAMTAVEVS
jgi:hypothetical protein